MRGLSLGANAFIQGAQERQRNAPPPAAPGAFRPRRLGRSLALPLTHSLTHPLTARPLVAAMHCTRRLTMARSSNQPRIPSQRDRAIFNCVRGNGHSQESVGRQYGLTQARVSQIVKRVTAWLAVESPAMLVLADEAKERRVAEAEYRLRLDVAYANASAAFEDSTRPLVTTRTKTTVTTK